MAKFDAMELARELEEQNAQLVELLRAKERELQSLRPLASAASRDPAAREAASQKVQELAKRNRATALAHERERRRADVATQETAQLKERIAELTKASGGGGGGGGRQAPAAEKDEVAKLQKQCADLRERAKDAESRASSLRVQSDRSKAERDRLHRIALRELGSEAELQRALEASAGGGGAASAGGGGEWRGRAQTISLLKDQLRDLRQQLKASQQHGGVLVGARVGAAPDGRAMLGAPGTSGRAHDRQRGVIEQKSEERRREHERALGQIDALKAELADCQKQLKGAVARRSALEADARDLRSKLGMVAAKTKRDDELIAALKSELGNARRKAASTPGMPGAKGMSGGTGNVRGYGTGAGDVHDRLLLELARREAQCDVQEKIILQLQGKRGIVYDGTQMPAR